MAEFLHGELTQAIIGAAMEVHRTLGAGFLEAIYERALFHELNLLGIEVRRQVRVPVQYKGVDVGKHRLDLLVDGKVVVELKAAAGLVPAHTAVVYSYLRATGLQVGLLMNFGMEKVEVRRVESRRGDEE